MHVRSTFMLKKCKKLFYFFVFFKSYDYLYLKKKTRANTRVNWLQQQIFFFHMNPSMHFPHTVTLCRVFLCSTVQPPLTCIVMAEHRAPFCRYFLACTALLHRAATRWRRRLIFYFCGSHSTLVMVSDSSNLSDAVLKALSFFFSLFLLGRISRIH